MAATEKDTKGDKIKTSIFLTCIGWKGREIYETFTFEPGDEMKLAPVLHKFLEYCNPRKNITILCHMFFTFRQQEGESFHDIVTELKKLSSKYEFDNVQDSLIKDMIVCGTKDILLRERLLWECDLTLSKAISACHAAEETCKHAHKIQRSQPSANTYKILKKKHSKSNHNTYNQNTREHEIEKDESDEHSDQSNYEFFVETVNIQDSAHINQINNEYSDWSITLNSNGIPVSYKIDTGAQCNVFPLTILKKFDPEPSFWRNRNSKKYTPYWNQG